MQQRKTVDKCTIKQYIKNTNNGKLKAIETLNGQVLAIDDIVINSAKVPKDLNYTCLSVN